MEIVISVVILVVVALAVVALLRSDLFREGRKIDEVYGYRDHTFERARDDQHPRS